MRRNAYNRARAAALLPLLRSISTEILERRAKIERLVSVERGPARASLREGDLHALQAELATHRFELRRALAELSNLGCQATEDGPLTIRIPGRAGDLTRGYSWRPGEIELRRVAGAVA